MKKLCLILLVFMVAPSFHAQRSHPEEVGAEMEQPKFLINSDAIKRVIIFHVPDALATRVALSPQALLAMAKSNFEITKDIKAQIGPVFAGISYGESDHVPDLRWAMFFYDSGNKELGSVFVDGFGQFGYVDKKKVNFQIDGRLPSDLTKSLHKLTGDPN